MHEEDPDLLAGEALDRLRGRNTADEIKQLRKERDEARRMYCNTMADAVSPYRSPEDIASGRGWDCFEKKNSNV